MNVEQEIIHLKTLFKNTDDNVSEIIRVYYNMVRERNCCDSNVIHFLNQAASQLLSHEVSSLLKKHRLDAFGYILIANNLLDLEDVKEDLLNGNVLMENTPSNAVRKLKTELGLATFASSSQSSNVTPAVSATTSANKEIKLKCRYTKNKNSDIVVNKVPLKRAFFFWNLFHRQRISIPKPIATKTIFLMKRTGEKAMANAVINYARDVKLEEDFRFLFIDKDMQKLSEAFCQTRGVRAYDIQYKDGFRYPYSLNFVDNTVDSGERDNQVASKFMRLIEHKHGTRIHSFTQELNTVAFVIQSFASLTTSKKFIGNWDSSILMSKNVKESLNFLISFVDETVFSDLATISKKTELPCQITIVTQINSLFSRSLQSPSEKISSIQLEREKRNFQSFFAELYTMRIKSLQQSELTKELLFSRNLLKKTEVLIDEDTVKTSNSKIQTIEKLRNALQMKIDQLKRIVEVSNKRINYCSSLLKNIALLDDGAHLYSRKSELNENL